MLDDAARLLKAGRSAIVVVMNHDQTTGVTMQLFDRIEDGPPNSRFAVMAYEPGLINWDTLSCPRYRSVYPDHALYVDHHVIETVFRRQLSFLHGFDLPARAAAPQPQQTQTTFGTAPSRRILRP
jgi:hypothetical protein